MVRTGFGHEQGGLARNAWAGCSIRLSNGGRNFAETPYRGDESSDSISVTLARG